MVKTVVETVSCIEKAYILSTLPLDVCRVTGVAVAKHTLYRRVKGTIVLNFWSHTHVHIHMLSY